MSPKLLQFIFQLFFNAWFRFLLLALLGLMISLISVVGLAPLTLARESRVISQSVVHPVAYPSDANFVNVHDYGVQGDGRTDDTQALRAAIQANLNQHRTLLFPAGTYLISDSLEWKGENGVYYAFLTWQGEGTGKTVIQLQDHAPGFADPQHPKPMTRSGSIESANDGAGNRAHNNYIFDMTFNTGRGNPGAMGVDFTASNTGAMENVEIVSGDGQGVAGLNLTREVGPCLIKNVMVEGFDVGIRAGAALYSITLEQIRLKNQNVAGIQNVDNLLAIRRLSSSNQVPALVNGGDWSGSIVLLDSELKGGTAETVAIQNSGHLLARNVVVNGYGTAIQSGEQRISEGQVKEFVSSAPIQLFDSPLPTLNLPVAETPQFLDNNLENWANVETYGARRDDNGDDAEGIQLAIDSGKSTIYFPFGTYKLDQPVIVRGNVRRIIGFHSSFAAGSSTLFRFENQNPVVLERFNFFSGGSLENNSLQPVGIRHTIGLNLLPSSQKSQWFLENVVANPIQINPGQTLYARQLNIESPPPEPMLTNNGGTMWLLGYKTEFGSTVAKIVNGGQTEILGGLFYPAQGVSDAQLPLLLNQNAAVSATYREIAFGPTYTIHIEETRQQQTQVLLRDTLGHGAIVSVPLYTGYEP